jgi:hypothetical protein
MSYTQADVDALEAALKSGVLRVRFADRDVTYRSQAELSAQLNLMKQQVSGAPGGGPRHSLASFSEPFGS